MPSSSFKVIHTRKTIPTAAFAIVFFLFAFALLPFNAAFELNTAHAQTTLYANDTNSSLSTCNGFNKDLTETAGSSAASQDISDGSLYCWYTPAQTIEIGSGTWTATFEMTTAGGGQAGKADITIDIADSNGTVTETIATCTTAGNPSGETVCEATGVASKSLSNNTIRISVLQNQGARTISVHYNGAAGGASDTRLVHPSAVVAPTVTTNAETNVDDTSATLNGEITATGGEDATQHGFTFGTNSSLSGGDTATSTLGGFTGTGTFNENQTSLDPNTTYYFRAYATNSAGTSYGAINTFTTDESVSAPTITTNAASSVDHNSATLNGNVDNTGGEDTTTCGFAWGTDSSLSNGDTATTTGATCPTGTGAFSEGISSLSADTQYFFRAYAINSGGTGLGGINNFTTNSSPGASSDLAQSAYRWFTNTDSTDVGSASTLNTPSLAPSQGTPFRLRMLLHVSSAELGVSATTTKLQFGESDGTCNGNESYSDVTTASTIRYFDNNTPSDNTALTANSADPIHGSHTIVNQTYNDGDVDNTFSNSQAAIPTGQDGLWDFALVDNSAPANTTYCFRAVQSGGGLLTAGYEQFPEITTPGITGVRLVGKVVLRNVRLF